jgi:hypothetical protein
VTDTTSNEILVFVCLIHRYKDTEPPNNIVNPGGNFDPGPGFDLEFGPHVMGELQKLEDAMNGTEHFGILSWSFLSAFKVNDY